MEQEQQAAARTKIDATDFKEIVLGVRAGATGIRLENLLEKFQTAKVNYNDQTHKVISKHFSMFRDSDRAYENMMKVISAAIAYKNKSATVEQKALLYRYELRSRYDSALDFSVKLSELDQIALILNRYYQDNTAGGDDCRSHKFHLAVALSCKDSREYHDESARSLCESFKITSGEYVENKIATFKAALPDCQTAAIDTVLTKFTLERLFAAFEKAEAHYKQQTHIKLEPVVYHFKKSVQHWTRFSQLIAGVMANDQGLKRLYKLDQQLSVNTGLRAMTEAEQCLYILSLYFDVSTPGGTNEESMKMHVVSELLGCDMAGITRAEADRVYQGFMTRLGDQHAELRLSLGLQNSTPSELLAQTADRLPYLVAGKRPS